MSDERQSDTASEIIRRWPANKLFDLEVVSWLQRHHGASHGGGRTDFSHLDDLEVQVCCQQVRHWRGEKATVGENPRQNLNDLRFTLKLRSAETVFAGLDTVPSAQDHDAWQGYLTYFKSAEVFGDIWLGAETIREIARVLAFRPGQKVRILLTVKAMHEPTKGAMTFDRDFSTTTYHWTSETAHDWLYITEAVVIIENAPISEEPEAGEDERMLYSKPSWPSVVGILVGNLFIAWLVYKVVMHAGSTDAFTWDAGPLGAGSLGAGSVSALWMGFLAFMSCQWIAGVCVLLGQVTADIRRIRASLLEFTGQGRRHKNRGRA